MWHLTISVRARDTRPQHHRELHPNGFLDIRIGIAAVFAAGPDVADKSGRLLALLGTVERRLRSDFRAIAVDAEALDKPDLDFHGFSSWKASRELLTHPYWCGRGLTDPLVVAVFSQDRHDPIPYPTQSVLEPLELG